MRGSIASSSSVWSPECSVSGCPHPWSASIYTGVERGSCLRATLLRAECSRIQTKGFGIGILYTNNISPTHHEDYLIVSTCLMLRLFSYRVVNPTVCKEYKNSLQRKMEQKLKLSSRTFTKSHHHKLSLGEKLMITLKVFTYGCMGDKELDRGKLECEKRVSVWANEKSVFTAISNSPNVLFSIFLMK